MKVLCGKIKLKMVKTKGSNLIMNEKENKIDYWKYYNKKIKFKDKEKFEYIGVVENYESKVDSDNGKCGEIYVGVEKSNNPKIKNGKAWVFLEDQITEIEEIN